MLKSGGAEINVICLGEKPISAIYNIGVNGVFHYYQSGFDPDYGSTYGLGKVSLVLSIKGAIENLDVAEFDLMIGPLDSYKKDYATLTTHAYDIMVFNNSAITSLVHGISILKSILKKYVE